MGVRVPFWAVFGFRIRSSKGVADIPTVLLRRAALFVFSAVLAGCGQAYAPARSAAQTVAGTGAVSAETGYKVDYSFRGHPSGATPTGLTSFDGAQYGTTIAGGTHTFGGVFVRNATGVKMLYSFQGGTDGASPTGALVAFGGKLYGTTEYGGAAGDGTVFSIDTQGNEHVVYAFKGGSDGAAPAMGALLGHNGALYGTASAGGEPSCRVGKGVGCGIIFSVTAAGSERVLHRFRGKPDGAAPMGSLIESGGKIYGTTEFGGLHDNGSIFAFSGTSVHLLYSFKGYPDGANPYAGLVLSHGTFYGTTAFGGAFDYSGTVYSLSRGVEHVLHSFRGTPDGAVPVGSLTLIDGTFYGTTEYGGSNERGCTGRGIGGCGIIFRITASGNQKTLHVFRGFPDGSNPWGSPILRGDRLYGTTTSGGRGGEGTIFSMPRPAK
ncbi:MAG TPA: choice-of-anchor tandem repeat GloVer-containing protein [Candidatus Cybelea sp.]|nr:choice-of-anchor tandem repeat GloVer-containing protein [Candidatus Cybelea sp.]